MAQSAAERQAARHRRLRDRGMERVGAYVDPKTAATFRRLAKDHDQPQAEVLRIGVLAAARILAGEMKLVPAGTALNDNAWRVEP